MTKAQRDVRAAAAMNVPTTTQLRKAAGSWLKAQRQAAGLSQLELARSLRFKYYTFISQVENGFGRVPSESMRAWAEALGVPPATFARILLNYYDPHMYRLLFKDAPK